jgi:hypothetical protein
MMLQQWALCYFLPLAYCRGRQPVVVVFSSRLSSLCSSPRLVSLVWSLENTAETSTQKSSSLYDEYEKTKTNGTSASALGVKPIFGEE